MIQKYTEQFKRPELFASINGQIVSVPVESENPLRTAEMTLEDDYGMIDGIINNGRCSKKLEKIRDEVHRPCRRKRPPSGSSRGTQNESTWSGSFRTSLPLRKSLRSWATYEPD